MAEKQRGFFGIDTEGKRPYVTEGTRSIMGTSVTITVVHPSVGEAKEALSMAFKEIHRIEDLMSIYKEDSEISILNKNGFYENAKAETINVVEKAIYYSNLSEGAFSIGILPLLELWEDKLETGKFPTETEINEVLELADHRNIVVTDRNIRFRKGGMRITLGGIAKGYAVDRAIEALRRKSVSHALVNAGGDIRAIGGKTEDIPWRIAVRDPQNKRRFITVVKLRDRAIATSGSYERYIGKEMKVSHIINAMTGQPAQELMSTTVIAEEAIDADALSTVVFIIGAERGMDLVERLNGVEALIVTKNKTVLKSSGFQSHEVSHSLAQ